MSAKCSTVKYPVEALLIPPVRSDEKTEKQKHCFNDSKDSGIAGIREQHHHYETNTVNNNDIELPEYIVDAGTRTTYLKGKFLGKGGFARVHELLDLTTNTVYAVKIIPKSHITKSHHKEKIAREIDVHRNLIHKNVVRFHHCFEDAHNVYIVLENCPRKSLVHILKHRCTLEEPEVRYFLRQLVEGVRYIHSQNIIHRDLKPGNMFLSKDLCVKVGDFGLATRVDGDKKVTICGTPNYIAPEVLRKLSYSYEADVWAVGCIMYVMLVGQPPFETTTLEETYERIISNKFVIPPLFSAPARALISQLLHPVPSERPSLDGILNHEFFTCKVSPEKLRLASCYITSTPATNVLVRPRSQNLENGPSVCNEVRKITSSLSTVKISTSKSPRASMKKSSCEKRPTLQSSKDTFEKKDQRGQSALKQKLTSVLYPDCVSLCRKRVHSASTIYEALKTCLENMSAGNANPPVAASALPTFVSKWIDYSNKFGFGFQLSDQSVGVLFNDHTKISFTPDKSRIEFHDLHGKVTVHPTHSVPVALQERFMSLCYFNQYMEEKLADGADMSRPIPKRKTGIPYMRRWVRITSSIIMELSNATIQLNFMEDHTKLIVSVGKGDYLITYINLERQGTTYRLHQLEQHGCEPAIRERLKYAVTVIKEFAELDCEDL